MLFHGRFHVSLAVPLLVALFFASAAHAADDSPLSLEQALGIASERNRAVAKAIEFRNETEGVYISERAAALPRLTVKGNYARERDEALGIDPYHREETSLQLDQALFTWGQVRAAIRAAQLGMETADERLRASRQSALRDTAAAFYDILLARELNSTFAQTLELKSRRLAEARKRQAVGLATEYDVLVAEVAETNARPEVVRTENLVRTRCDRLRLILGIDRSVDVAGDLTAPLVAPPEYEQALALARDRRPELRDLNHRIDIAAEFIDIARAGDKPRLDLAGNYGWKVLDYDDEDLDGKKWDVGLKLTWPIFDGLKAHGKVLQTSSERAALMIDRDQQLDAIGVEIREALDKIRVATELVQALEGTVTQAQKLVRLSEKGFEFGVKIRLEVDDAEENLRQSRSSLAVARREYLVAMIDLALAMGILGEETFPGLPVAQVVAKNP